jgi:hypothetical protein
MDNAKGGMAVTEREYIATANLQESKPVSHLIHSNVKEIVEQQQFVFKSFWVNAIPAAQRIMEIEEGVQRIETKVLDDAEDIYNKIMLCRITDLDTTNYTSVASCRHLVHKQVIDRCL